MNQYGRQAQAMWEKYAPDQAAALGENHFVELGEDAATRIEQLYQELARAVPADLPYWERLGQLGAAQLQAREVVLTNLIYSPLAQASPTDPTQEMMELAGQLPGRLDVIDMLLELKDAQEEEQLSPEQIEPRRQWLQAVQKIARTDLMGLEPADQLTMITQIKALLHSQAEVFGSSLDLRTI